LRILFATPAYWPATAFGGPIAKLRELGAGLAAAGHEVRVVTTALEGLDGPRTLRTVTRTVDGVEVAYAATPLRFRWMGITPTLPLLLRRLPRPDVVHVFGFRDVVGTVTAAWCAATGIPYVLEPLGMFRPRLRKVPLKRVLDETAFRFVPRRAAAVVATSGRERDDVLAGGVPASNVEVRPNGFPKVAAASGGDALRARLGIGDAPLALYVGRIAAGKGIEFLLDAARALPDLHAVLAGPDDGHGTARLVRAAETADGTRGRVHWLGIHERPAELYGAADVVVLASEGESFGSAAAEAAAAGAAVVVTDRCGVAELLGPADAAVVVPYDARAVVDAISRVAGDAELRVELGARARRLAEEHSWERAVQRQEQIYRRVLAGR
jgi:glycosyltransferase involved in cell wall biosynthesis